MGWVMKEATSNQTLSYAPAEAPNGSRVWAAAVLAATGLGLIALGGCFLIGVLVLFYPSLAFGPASMRLAPPWSWGTYLFASVLSLLAVISFLFGAWLLWVAVIGLLRVLNWRGS
jgi:hypothetical protein